MTVDPSSAPFWLGDPRAHQSLSPIHMPQTVDTQSLTVIVQLDTEPMLLGAAAKFFVTFSTSVQQVSPSLSPIL